MQNQVLNYNLVPASEIQNQARPGGIVVDISPAAWAAYEQSRANGTLNPAGAGRGLDATDPTQCATCDSRRYQDVSDDSSVSFQAPTHISPGASAALVAAHEGEHVANEQAKASQEGREIVSQSVRLFTSICPECGRMYVSGGETRTLSASKPEESAEPAPEGSTGPTA